MVHQPEHISQLLEHLELVSIEPEVRADLTKAHGTQGKWFVVGFLELTGSVHQTLVSLTMSYREDMRQLMARSLNGPVLNLPCDLRCELPGVLLTKLWMMTRITLNADLPALFRHSKHERPAILWVQISIC